MSESKFKEIRNLDLAGRALQKAGKYGGAIILREAACRRYEAIFKNGSSDDMKYWATYDAARCMTGLADCYRKTGNLRRSVIYELKAEKLFFKWRKRPDAAYCLVRASEDLEDLEKIAFVKKLSGLAKRLFETCRGIPGNSLGLSLYAMIEKYNIN